jgi:hypothetical protein
MFDNDFTLKLSNMVFDPKSSAENEQINGCKI